MTGKTAVFTIGHSTHPIRDFVEILKAYDVQRVVDVRTVPRSRHNPQFNKEVLPNVLKKAKIKYTHMKGLGGLRKTSEGSPNLGWRNASFRGFADYMQTEEFSGELKRLIKFAGKERLALMCAEAVPWRCHRSLISDALLVRKIEARHIYSATNSHPHTLTPFAKVRGMKITYP